MSSRPNHIEWNMTNHTPTPTQIESIEEIRDAFKEVGELIAYRCPASRELSLAVTNLEQALMWAVASIARDQPERPGNE